MEKLSLEAPLAKISRASENIELLEERIRDLYYSKLYEHVAELTDDGLYLFHGFLLKKKIPTSIMLDVGEIIQNIRAPLDQMLAELVELHGKSASHVQFPFGDDQASFDKALSEQKKIPEYVKDIIRAEKPFLAGNKYLWALNKINKNDKHRTRLIPINMPAETTVSYLIVYSGYATVIGSKDGQHMVLNQDPTNLPAVKDGQPTQAYDARPFVITLGNPNSPVEENLEFMTTTKGAEYQTDFSPSLNIGFNIPELRGEPILDVIKNCHQAVSSILKKVQDGFTSHQQTPSPAPPSETISVYHLVPYVKM